MGWGVTTVFDDPMLLPDLLGLRLRLVLEVLVFLL